MARALIGLAALIFLTAPRVAVADTPPQYDGTMTFAAIEGPEDPEEYTWFVLLGDDQALEAVDDTSARVVYKDPAHLAFEIHAIPAHDASGRAVPTTMFVTEPDLVTLVVHHRAGVPGTGAPFDYPVIGGAGWTVIDQGGIIPDEFVAGPPISIANPWTPERFGSTPSCEVPALKGLRLRAAKRALRSSGCSPGAVRKRRGARLPTGTVVRQWPHPRETLAAGTAVNLTIG